MKKLIAFIALMFLFSCESEEECKICTMVCNHPEAESLHPTTSVSMFKACSEELIAVDGRTLTSTMTINNQNFTVTCKTTCK
jgi:hypothetical protein